jgi:hypothetical protein
LSLDSKSDPAIVQKCAHFFIDNGQYEKAVDLLAMGKQVGPWRRLIAARGQDFEYLLVPNILNRYESINSEKNLKEYEAWCTKLKLSVTFLCVF